jgi:tRNA(Ile2) C34 agmatinyltransferase TiaS
VEKTDDCIIQHIRCIGGPAYSLSDMMARAEGVIRVEAQSREHLVEGSVWTNALMQVTVGIDDTDTREGGATFALALALLDHLSRIKGVLPISHHVVMLNPGVAEKTAGNSASYLELAVRPDRYESVIEKIRKFVAGESLSPEWGVAIRRGLTVSEELREYGRLVREQIISRPVAEAVAANSEIMLYGGNGVIGALGAVALTNLPHEILFDPAQNDF